MPKVSVIMPAYNVEDYIGESIESVLKQTYTDFELLVINDGTKDRSGEIAISYADRDGRIRVIDRENGGLPAARNTGLQEAQGRYIAFLDSDDLWRRDYLEKIVSLAESKGEDHFYFARTEEFFADGKRVLIGPQEKKEGTIAAYYYEKSSELRLAFHISAVLVPKALLDTYGIKFFENLRNAEDNGFYYCLLSVASAAGTDEVLTEYRRREASITTLAWEPQSWAFAIRAYEMAESFVMEYASEEDIDIFHRVRGYHAYRFLRKCLKQGFYDDFEDYREEFLHYVTAFAAGEEGKWMDRQKARCLLSDTWLAKTLRRML